MKALRSIACMLVLTGGWLWGGASPCFGASLMVEKNLFAPDRKPPSPDTTAPAAKTNKPGLTAKAVQLDGIFIRGDTRKAIMRVKGQNPDAGKAKAQNPYVTVKEGEKIGDLQVVKIEFRSVSLEKDGQVEVVKLFGEGKVAPPPPPVPTAPGATTPQPGQAATGAEAAKGQVQPGGQGPAAGRGAGAKMPGVAQAPGAPPGPGSQRGLLPPGQMESQDAENLPEEEENIEEGGDESAD